MLSLLLKEIRHNPLLWLLVFVPAVFAGGEARARGAHAALRAVRPGHRPARGAAEPRHRVRGVEDGRRGRGPAERDARQPDRAGHRAHGPARRAVHAGEGVDRRGDRHQHALHAGGVVPARRAEAPRAGVQPGQRPRPGGPAVPGHDRAPRSLGARREGPGAGGGDADAEPGPRGAAHRRLRPGHALLAQDASRALRQRGARRGGRGALAPGPRPRHAGRRHGAGGARQRGLRRVGAAGGGGVRDDPRLRGLHRGGARGRRGGDGLGVLRRAQEPPGPERGDRARQRVPDRPLRRPGAGAPELRPGPGAR